MQGPVPFRGRKGRKAHCRHVTAGREVKGGSGGWVRPVARVPGVVPPGQHSRLTALTFTIIEVFMRRFLAIIALPLLACLVIAGCSSSKPAPAASPTATANANAAVTVTGAFGTTPVVHIPKLKATDKLTVKTVVPGTGATVT